MHLQFFPPSFRQVRSPLRPVTHFRPVQPSQSRRVGWQVNRLCVVSGQQRHGPLSDLQSLIVSHRLPAAHCGDLRAGSAADGVTRGAT
jgi:hypothetical protein